MDDLTKVVLQAHTEALIQILYRLPNPPKSAAAKLYSALEKLGGRTPRSNQPTETPENHDYSPSPAAIEPPTPITPAIAEALLQEAKERQLKLRQQRTGHRLPENTLSDDPMRPENDLSNF